MNGRLPDRIVKSQKTALVVGATGLVGSALISRLIAHPGYLRVLVFARRPLLVDHPKIQVTLLDFERLSDYADQIRGDDLFICLGTTMQKAGSKAAFVKVDLTYNLIISRIAAANGVKQLILLSAVGADINSTFFYNRVKGALEEQVKKLPFWSIHIFRPAVLLGEREDLRPGEWLAGKVTGWLNNRVVKLGRYTPVAADRLAQAMLEAACRLKPGLHHYSSPEILALS